MTYIQAVKAPLLVQQGENDIRVPAGQAKQVVEALKKKGNMVDSVFYPEEGHGFYKREHQQDSLQRMVDWFDKYLKGGPQVRSAVSESSGRRAARPCPSRRPAWCASSSNSASGRHALREGGKVGIARTPRAAGRNNQLSRPNKWAWTFSRPPAWPRGWRPSAAEQVETADRSLRIGRQCGQLLHGAGPWLPDRPRSSPDKRPRGPILQRLRHLQLRIWQPPSTQPHNRRVTGSLLDRDLIADARGPTKGRPRRRNAASPRPACRSSEARRRARAAEVEVERENVGRAAKFVDGIAIAADRLEQSRRRDDARSRTRAAAPRGLSSTGLRDRRCRSESTRKAFDVERLAVGRVERDRLVGSFAALACASALRAGPSGSSKRADSAALATADQPQEKSGAAATTFWARFRALPGFVLDVAGVVAILHDNR